MDREKLKAVSLFSGAGGMDLGFIRAGFKIIWANDFDRQACKTYRKNIGDHIVCGKVEDYIQSLAQHREKVDCLFGGPPCQGFSVAGKMDLEDERSQLVFRFMDAVETILPKCFVMENVRALGALEKFRSVREKLVKKAIQLGYKVELKILNSHDFGVPQSRERMFLFGFLQTDKESQIDSILHRYTKTSPTVREAIAHLGPAGTELNPEQVNAKITLARRPILRKSPYAGMLFNGQGRPVDPDSYSSTLHASMGGNRTPIIDEKQLYEGAEGWVVKYHDYLMKGGRPYSWDEVPNYLRRMTVTEAAILQTFPEDYKFVGSQSVRFRQIGNAVPPLLAEAVAKAVRDILTEGVDFCDYQKQSVLEFF